ncbi:DNA replication/repair protein RecF [Asticcacaulis sp. EMRT-3]|uniref:DNA replication/repair protein RecF n=1 Tax=Asticcacaulis sp. EMRT-3 TaxID=3040349 RepID=UPI0024AE9A8D|nr:DNA replication/repair protein RecF [Asticcacaulis sp. EMRT-3]MDI7775666.1 DNA replication/repair protein RecF [Asticcacaulis sp. EMRT-3]
MTAPTPHALQHLSLTEFRSYERLDFAVAGRSVYLYGPNGAGKTNLLEAISVLNPGKGLRGAAFADLGRRLPDEARGRGWGVAARLCAGEDEVRLSTGSDPRDPAKRLIRLEGETVTAARLLDHVRLIWLTPAQDRLFIEARAERLRFFDRLVYAAFPAHATTVSAYEKALRERLKLLTEGLYDEAWLAILEQRLSEHGARMMSARHSALDALQAEIETHHSAFPKADLSLINAAAPNDPNPDDLASGFRAARSRDAAAGRSLFGPHRADLAVVHRDKKRRAADCSTGEQKALLLNIILAQGARLAKGKGARLAAKPNAASPILLLDEVAAHLDPLRRHALFDETHALGLQTFFTGTDLGLFDGLKSRALGVALEAGQFIDFID